MTSATTNTIDTPKSYHTLLSTILSQPHVFYSSPTSPHPLLIPQSKSSGTPTISSLSLHPTLESALHILNLDLPSAHFLLRHAETNPATEMMYLHGILHRVEGDVTNTRAWYSNIVDSDVFRHVWGTEDEGWKGFLDRVERWRDSIASRRGSKGKDGSVDWTKEEGELRELSLWEIRRVVGYCERKFGVERLECASGVWLKKDTRIGGKHNDMVVGGEGWREW